MHSPPFRLRRLGADDAPVFRSLRLEALASHPEAFGAAHEEEAARPLANVVARVAASHVVGAFSGAELAGVAAIMRQEGLRRAHRARIWGFYVRPAFRRTGLAGQLLDALVAAGRGMGVAWIDLAVNAGNLPATRLYEGRGFVAYGREPAALRVDGTDHDETLMTLAL